MSTGNGNGQHPHTNGTPQPQPGATTEGRPWTPDMHLAPTAWTMGLDVGKIANENGEQEVVMLKFAHAAGSTVLATSPEHALQLAKMIEGVAQSLIQNRGPQIIVPDFVPPADLHRKPDGG